jgi:hypothetical protein
VFVLVGPMMFGDRRNPFSDPAKELEFNLIRHALRMHFDSLMMLSTSLFAIRTGGGTSQLAREIEGLTDRVCADLDALDAMLPESLDEHDHPHDEPPAPPSDQDAPGAGRR